MAPRNPRRKDVVAPGRPTGGAASRRPKRPKRPPIKFSVGRPTTRPSRPNNRPPQNPAGQPPAQRPPAQRPPAQQQPPGEYDDIYQGQQPSGPSPYMNENALRIDAAETRRRQEALARLGQQRQALGIGYGFGEFGGDAESNPYSRAALLQRNYERNQRASTNSMAAAGQLYAGSLSNARNFNRFNYDVSFDSLRKQYDAALARLNDQELAANTRYEDQLEGAQRDAVNQGQEDERPEAWEADPFPNQGGNQGDGQGGNQGGGQGRGRANVGQASKRRRAAAQKRINTLRKLRGTASNPRARKRISRAIQVQRTVVARNQQRITNINQGRPPNQGIKPKPKKGKR